MTAGQGRRGQSWCAAFIFGPAPGARVLTPQERDAILEQQLMAKGRDKLQLTDAPATNRHQRTRERIRFRSTLSTLPRGNDDSSDAGQRSTETRFRPDIGGLARCRGVSRCPLSRRHAGCGWWLRRRGRVLRHLGLSDHRAALARGEHIQHRPAGPLLRSAGPPTAACIGHGRRRHHDQLGCPVTSRRERR
jgi:hypothetical protein